ncbi:MAG: hypothetical protein Q9195_007062 [Heterodermia aff. obscurata]
MADAIDSSLITTTNAVDQDGPSKTQWLPVKGRNLSPPLKRVIVYNREDKSMQVKRENSLDFTIFVDPETKLIPTTSDVDSDGYSNLFVVKLHLDRLGLLNRILWFFGFIQNIYVMNPIPQWSESSSLRIDAHRVAGVMA